jgi:predicted RNase H-like HicB family nuclease
MSQPTHRPNYRVNAEWDPEAAVWVATSDDVPGLATEASTMEALAEKLRVLIPELLEANDVLPTAPTATISYELVSHRAESVLVAS